VERAESGELLATAETGLLALDRSFSPVRLPESLRERLVPVPDPVRI
jgi:acyl-CoA thioesterase FadM